jgi:hypothetical protein
MTVKLALIVILGLLALAVIAAGLADIALRGGMS